MIAYFDTSAALKLVLVEDGSSTARDLWEAVDGRVCSVAMYPEARAAVAAALRGGRITAVAHARAKRALQRIMRKFDVIELGEPLAQLAGDVAERFRLRCYDAVHLASALSVAEGDLIFVSWDANLSEAAARARLATVP